MLTDRTPQSKHGKSSDFLPVANQSEIQLTLEAMLKLANDFEADVLDTRKTLIDARFVRAEGASEASIIRLNQRICELSQFLHALPNLDVNTASIRVNEELTELPISPSMVAHDEWPHHIHWTSSTARFDDQMLSDFMMALVLEMCENGTTRLGICSAANCNDLFYDSTRNRSRKFCSDGRCASRTHTADHRARVRSTS